MTRYSAWRVWIIDMVRAVKFIMPYEKDCEACFKKKKIYPSHTVITEETHVVEKQST